MFQYPKKIWRLPCKYHRDTPSNVAFVLGEQIKKLSIGDANMPRFTLIADKKITHYETLREVYRAFETAFHDITIDKITVTASDALEPLVYFDRHAVLTSNGKKIAYMIM